MCTYRRRRRSEAADRGGPPWYDHDTGEAYEGGKTHAIMTMESVPTFVRGGFIVSAATGPGAAPRRRRRIPCPRRRGARAARGGGDLTTARRTHTGSEGREVRAFEYREGRGGGRGEDPGAGGTFPGAEARWSA